MKQKSVQNLRFISLSNCFTCLVGFRLPNPLQPHTRDIDEEEDRIVLSFDTTNQNQQQEGTSQISCQHLIGVQLRDW